MAEERPLNRARPQEQAASTPAQPRAAAMPPRGNRPLRSPWLMLDTSVILWLGCGGCAFLSIYAFQQVTPQALQLFATVAIGIIAVALGTAAMALLLVGSVRWAVFGQDVRGQRESTDIEQIVQLLRVMNARLLLSDTAKRIAYRQEDVNALRRAIRDDIAKGDFDAALVLVQEMSNTFGYREEAESFREQIHNARAKDMERKISNAGANLDKIIAAHDFEHAALEAAKLQRLYPESEQVKLLVRKVVQSREQYKQELERRFLAAAERDDVDGAIQLLTEMDKYLTEQEAEPFRETARGVIGKRRDNQGVQFKMAVHDKEWLRAVHVGEQIIRDFPNTRMADEVRGMLDGLRQRAAEQQALATRR